jgi:hypothetical protein
VAAAELLVLVLYSCDVVDGGAALVKSVREGRGPKGLRCGNPRDALARSLDSLERFVSLIGAQRGNSHLERLDLPYIQDHDDITEELAAEVRTSIYLLCRT